MAVLNGRHFCILDEESTSAQYTQNHVGMFCEMVEIGVRALKSPSNDSLGKMAAQKFNISPPVALVPSLQVIGDVVQFLSSQVENDGGLGVLWNDFLSQRTVESCHTEWEQGQGRLFQPQFNDFEEMKKLPTFAEAVKIMETHVCRFSKSCLQTLHALSDQGGCVRRRVHPSWLARHG